MSNWTNVSYGITTSEQLDKC